MDHRDDASDLHVGLISGTSADGIDAALVRFDGAHCSLVEGATYPWDRTLRTRLVELGQGGDATSLDELGALDVQVAEAFAQAALQVIAAARVSPREVRSVGSHAELQRRERIFTQQKVERAQLDEELASVLKRYRDLKDGVRPTASEAAAGAPPPQG